MWSYYIFPPEKKSQEELRAYPYGAARDWEEWEGCQQPFVGFVGEDSVALVTFLGKMGLVIQGIPLVTDSVNAPCAARGGRGPT